MAKEVSIYINPYEKILANPGWVIDNDLLGYNFSIPVTVDEKLPSLEGYDKYLYSCMNKCPDNEMRLWELLGSHDYIKINSSEAEIYLIDLSKESLEPELTREINIKEIYNDNKFTNFRKIYSYFKNLFGIPQV